MHGCNAHIHMYMFTSGGVDLSKILGGEKAVKVINPWVFLNYWGATFPGCPKVYAYVYKYVYSYVRMHDV